MFVKRTACLLLACMLLISGWPAARAGAEPDDLAGHWAGETIGKWLAEGLIQGFPDGTFRPNESVTRAQFARLVNVVFGFTTEAELAYDDVPQDAWFARDLAIAVQAGYLKGYAERKLRPEQAMTRQEVAVVLARLLNLAPDEAAADGYADAIPAWSKGSVGAVTKAGYMGGYPDQTFRPARIMTRAEAVTILDRVLNSLVTTFDAAGTYGPETGTRTIRGHVVVKADHVTLRNMVITGNLTIAESVGDGEVTLDGVTVQGTTAILGGGENSIHIQDSRLGEVDVNRAGGPVRIVISGHSSVAAVTVHSGAAIETSVLKGDGLARLVIAAPEGTEIVLDGTFNLVVIASEHVIVEVTANSTVREMTLEKAAEVKGRGKIEKAVVQASGVKFERAPEILETSPGVAQPVIAQPVPSPSAPPSSGGGGGGDGGGGPVVPPAIVVAGVRAVNATTVEVVMDELAGATFTWNGKPVLLAEYRDGKYVLTVPYMTSGAHNSLVIQKTGYSSYKNEHVVWTDPLTYEEGKLGDWVTDRTEPGEWGASEDGWITLTTKEEPSNNWYAWQGRKAATDMPVTSDWQVETEIRLTEELLSRDGVRTSVWLNVVDPAGQNIDWAILQFRVDSATGTKGWQWWNSKDQGSWIDIPNLPAEAGTYKLAIHFSNGTVTQYINGVKVNEYTIDDDLSSVREVIFNSYSFGKAYTVNWKVPTVLYYRKFPAGASIISNADQLKAAIADDTIDTIYVRGTIPLSSTLKITRPIRIIGTGSGATITRASTWTVIGDPTSKGNAMLISVEGVAGPVDLGNIIVTGAKHRDMGSGKKDYGSGINIYQSGNVTLKGVASIGNAGAGVIVNGSKVVANSLTTSGNGWYGVGVAKGSNVTAETSFTIDASSILNEELEIVAEGDVTVHADGYTAFVQGGQHIYNKKPLDLMVINRAADVTEFRFAVNQYAETLGLSADSLARFNEMPADQGRQQAVWMFVQALGPFDSREDFKAAFEYAVAQEFHKYLFIQAVDRAEDANAMKTALEQHVPVLHADRQDLIARVRPVNESAAEDLAATTYTTVLAQLNAKLEAEADLSGLAQALLDRRNAEPNRQFFGVEKIAQAIREILETEESEAKVTNMDTVDESAAADPAADSDNGAGTDTNQEMG